MKNDIQLILAQFNPVVGDIAGNTDSMMELWRSKGNEVNRLTIFPELYMCGYPPEDLVLNTAFVGEINRNIERIKKESKTLSGGAIIPTIKTIDGKLYNVALHIENGEIVNVISKNALPNYNVFDEPRTFHSGEFPNPIVFRGHKIGIMICEDIWYPQIPAHLQDKGAEVLIAINASPYYKGKDKAKKELFKNNIVFTGLDLVYLNMYGAQDELVFDGRSFVMNAKGEIEYQSPAFVEEVLELTISKDCDIQVHNEQKTILSERDEIIYEALKTGLSDYAHKNGFKKVLIGLSGGIDSALTAAIAVDALGSENVRCIMMPSEFTSEDSLEDAKECAELLGVQYDTFPISDVMTAMENTVPDLNGIAHENTQSRIRGNILMALSNMTGAMLVTTGNKSEMAVGYCTLYGDMNGGFNALKDVYKTEVYRLSKWRNTVSRVIPERIIEKPPTAELREGQTDQDSLPDYDLLDDILMLLIEYDNTDWSKASKDLVKLREKCAKYPDIVQKVSRLLKNAEYKRFQAAPGTRITYRAFGRDRRYPLTNHFVNNIEKSA